MCVCVYMITCIFMCIHLCIHACVYIYVYMYVFLYVLAMFHLSQGIVNVHMFNI